MTADRRTTDRSVLVVEIACFALMGAVVTLLSARRGDYDAAFFGGLVALLLTVTVIREYADRFRRRLVTARAR